MFFKSQTITAPARVLYSVVRLLNEVHAALVPERVSFAGADSGLGVLDVVAFGDECRDAHLTWKNTKLDFGQTCRCCNPIIMLSRCAGVGSRCPWSCGSCNIENSLTVNLKVFVYMCGLTLQHLPLAPKDSLLSAAIPESIASESPAVLEDVTR